MDMYGWDIITALSVSAVNQQLIDNFNKLLVTFNFQNNLPTAKTSLSGTFTSWQIVPGGSGKDVYVALEINTGSYRYTDNANPQNDKTFKLDGVIVTVELVIDFLASSTQTNQQTLTFTFKTDDGQVPNDTSIFCKNVIAPDVLGIDVASKALIGDAITQCLFNNASEVSYIFATLSLAGNQAVPAPSHYSFLTNTPEGSATDYFCILSTVIQDYNQAQLAVDPALFDQTSSMFTGLSANYFLDYLIKPQLPSVFQHGTDANSFQYANQQISNTGEIDMDKVKSGLIWYQPKITSLTMTIQDTSLQTHIEGTCHISSGIHVDFSSTSNSTILVASGSITFQADPNPQIDHHTEIAAWIIIGTGVLSPIVDAILAGIILGVSKGLANGLSTSLGALSMQQLNPEFINWQSLHFTTLNSGGLSTNFFLRGN